MSDIVIRAENLGKKYSIFHQQEGRRYVALRDIVSDKFRSSVRALRSSLLSPTGAALNARGELRSTKEEFWALKDVSFDVKEGDVVGIIGRNGAGKSTLLKVFSRITEPTEGRVRIKGRVASLLEVGTGFHPELTGRENIFLNGAILGMSRFEINRRFDEIVAFAEVERFLDTPVKHFSSGMYVRLAFAVAAFLEPEILVVDEVLAVGDSEFQKKCIGRMKDVSKSGRTVLFVSHNMASVLNLCSKCIWLEKGRFKMYGTPEEVLDNYIASSVTDTEVTRMRPRWAKPIIQDVVLRDKFGKARNAFALGEPITFEMRFDANQTSPLRRPVMGVVIHHITRGIVGGVSTRMTGFTPSDRSYANGVYHCIFNRIPLIQGKYTVDIWLGDGTLDLDTLSSVCQFNIEEGDVYGSGQIPFAELGVVFFEPEWKLISGDIEAVA